LQGALSFDQVSVKTPQVFPAQVFGVIMSLGRQKGKFGAGYFMQVL
jgi:hypothetical protein